MPVRRPTFAALALSSIALAAGARGADKPAAPPSAQPRTRPGAAATAFPDLTVTIDGSGGGLPSSFTVRNVGSADSKLSVLKVAATFIPLDLGGGSAGGCAPELTQEQCAALATLATIGSLGSGIPADTKTACGEPFKEFLEAIPVLRPGESKTFTRSAGPSRITLNFSKILGSPQATHVKKCPPTLVCAWDIVAKADASGDNQELNEANNTATRRAYREIAFQ